MAGETLGVSSDLIRESLARLRAVSHVEREHRVLEAQVAVNSPDFANRGRVHDWRNYVPEWARVHWHSIAVDSRVAIFLMADDFASREDWD